MERSASVTGLVTHVAQITFRFNTVAQRLRDITVQCLKALAQDFVASGLHYPYRTSVAKTLRYRTSGDPT